MHNRERYFIQTQGPNDAAFAALIQRAIEIENRLGGIERIVFVAHGLNNSGWLERQYGRDGVTKLKKGAQLPGSNITARFESLKNYDTVENEILITMGLRSDEILLLDDNPGIAAILALPWAPDDVDKWSRICEAINIETGAIADPYNDPDCIVKRALIDLTESINMATGLHHSSDDDLAKTYLRTLLKYEYPLPELDIEACLINDLDWRKEYADQLLAIINKINNGRSFQGGDKTNLKYHIDRWRKECE